MAETKTNYSFNRGLLIPDPRVTYAGAYSSTLSSITQAGPKPGDPVAQQETDMVLEALNTQSAAKQLRIRCLEAGGPGDGTFVWYYSGDLLYRGWEPPNTISGHEVLDFTTTANKWISPHAITLANGNVLVVAQKLNTTHRVACWVRTASTGAWAETEIYATGTTYVMGAYPTVVQLASGRVLCFFWHEVTTTRNQVRMYYSDNNGSTWTLGGQNVLASSVSTATDVVGRLRVAALPNGHLSMVAAIDRAAATYDDILFQWGSTDAGATFSLIDSTGWSGATFTTNAALPELMTVGNQIVLAYLVQYSAGNVNAAIRTISAVNQAFSAAEETRVAHATNWGNVAAGNITEGDLGACADEDGIIYLIGRKVTTRECFTVRSRDGGVTWDQPGSSSVGTGTNWWNINDTAMYPEKFAATYQAGRVVLIHTFQTDATTTDPSLCAVYLGGYTTVTMPFLDSEAKEDNVVGWERTWLGTFGLPSASVTWTRSTGGAGVTEAFTAAGLQITTAGAAGSVTYIAAPATTHTQGLISLTEFKVTAGEAFVQMRTSDATPVSYSVEVLVSTTAITLRDFHAGATIGTAETTTAGTTGVQILLALGNGNGALGNTGKVRGWWRPSTLSGEPDRQWEPIGSLGYSDTLQALAVATDDLQFGLSSGTNSDIRIRLHCYTHDTYAGKNLYGGQVNPTDMLGRPFSSTGVWVDDGVKVRATAGPAYQADTWNIDTRYTHGIENIFYEVSPSPSRGWRSTGETQQDIVVELDRDLGQNTRPLGSVVALFLTGVNFQTFEVAEYSGGAYNLHHSADTSSAQKEMPFVRDGDTVWPSASVAGTPSDEWYTYHVLAGSHIRLDDNAGSPNVVIRTIGWNSEGAWRQNNDTTLVARCILTDTVSTDPTGDGIQRADILSKDICVIMPDLPECTRIRIRIQAQDTAEGYFTIGKMLIGHVAYFGAQYSHGRVLGVRPIFDTRESRSGVRRSTKLANARRTAEIAWVEGVDASQIGGSVPTPDFLASATGLRPVAVPGDTAHKMLGIIEACGPGIPVVYLPKIRRQAAYATIQYVNRNHMLYATMTSAGSAEATFGLEWENPGELFTVGKVTFEEEL